MTQNSVFADKNEAFKAFRTLGEMEAKGQVAGPEFIVKLAIAVEEGHVAEADAEACYKEFRKRQVKVYEGNVVDPIETASNFKQKVSVCKVVMNAASNPAFSFSDVLNDARPIIISTKAAGVHKMSTWDAFYAIARAQREIQTALDEDGIRKALEPKKGGKERNAVVSLEAIKKLMKVHLEGTQGVEGKSPPKEAYPSERVASALRLVEQEIAALTFADQRAKYEALNGAAPTA
jgi:hypothetical protein